MAHSTTRRKRKRPPTEAALLHGTTGISQVSQWNSFPYWTVTTLNPLGRNPLLNGLISKSCAAPVLRHLRHRRCSTHSVLIMPDHPATNRSPSMQFSTLPNLN